MDVLWRRGYMKLSLWWGDLLIAHSEAHTIKHGLYGVRVLEVGAELTLQTELPRKWCLGEAQALEVEVNELQSDACIDALAGEDPVKLERKVCPRVHAVEGEPEVPRLEGAVEGNVLQMQATAICLMQSASDRELCMRAEWIEAAPLKSYVKANQPDGVLRHEVAAINILCLQYQVVGLGSLCEVSLQLKLARALLCCEVTHIAAPTDVDVARDREGAGDAIGLSLLGCEEAEESIGLGAYTATELETARAVHLKDFAERTREIEVEDVGPLEFGLTNLYCGECPRQLSLHLEWSEEAVTGKGIEEFASIRGLLERLSCEEKDVLDAERGVGR